MRSSVYQVVLACLVGCAFAAEIPTPEVDREGKLFSVFQIVQFNNDACNATNGLLGTCYTSAECTSKNLTASGTCASGFGVCCVATLGTSQDRCADGTVTVSSNNTYLTSPGYPSGVSTSGCPTSRQSATNSFIYKIGKFSSTTTQLRLDFLEYETDAPSAGECSNGTLTITGADTITTRSLPSNLCGMLGGQHIYLSVADLAVTGTVTITITLSSLSTQKWNILVRQFESTQTDLIAPRGCLQYFRESAATFSTFNYNAGNGEILNNHGYAVCIADVNGFCDVALTATGFDLDANSKLVLGGTTYTGTTFGTAGTATWTYMGPYVASVMTTSANSGMNSGFSLSYLLLPC